METAHRLTVVETAITALQIDVSTLKADVSTLKADVSSLKTDVAVMKSNYVTKEDLEKAINKLTWKMYGFGTALVAVVYFIARNVY